MMTNLVVSAEGLRNYILEGVDNLRIRKCRPDRETIAHYVLRKYGGSLNDIFTELENIVDEGVLLKVEYKGSTSYRTPQSFDQKNSPLLTKHSKILNSTKTTRLILTTINDLLLVNPDYCTSGIPLAELKIKLREQEPVRFADDKVDTAFGREVSIGNVLLGEGGRVYPKDIQPKRNLMSSNSGNGVSGKATETSSKSNQDAKVPKKRGRKSNAEKAALAALTAGGGSEKPTEVKICPVAKSGEAKIEEKVAEAVRKTFDGRVSGRNKIKRKVFDPSDVPVPSAAAKAVASGQSKKRKRGSTARDTIEICEGCNKKRDSSEFVVCSSCSASYHTACMGISIRDGDVDSKGWLCSDCQICHACSSPIKSSNQVQCVKCKSVFHAACVGSEADFICGECVFGTQTPSVPVTERAETKRKGRPPKNRRSECDVNLVSSTVSSSADESGENLSNGNTAKLQVDLSADACKIVEGTTGPAATQSEIDCASTNLTCKFDSSEPNKDQEMSREKKCSDWTPSDVENFFNGKGLPEAGALFREQVYIFQELNYS